MSHLTIIILAVLITSWFAFSIYLYSILIEVKESEGRIQEHLKEYDSDIEWDCEEIKKAV
jgi:hypothetical protein